MRSPAKRRRGELGFDDMLSRLDEALRGDSGETLASAIRQRFPVAMIDEFQDTDPQQYRIFRRIWRRQPETALLLIGDPKQAIYAFRGADIFTYMKARGDVAAHYTSIPTGAPRRAWWAASIGCSASAITPSCSTRSRSCR